LAPNIARHLALPFPLSFNTLKALVHPEENRPLDQLSLRAEAAVRGQWTEAPLSPRKPLLVHETWSRCEDFAFSPVNVLEMHGGLCKGWWTPVENLVTWMMQDPWVSGPWVYQVLFGFNE
jgi:hypothetical protein